jgi:hypothetical protein
MGTGAGTGVHMTARLLSPQGSASRGSVRTSCGALSMLRDQARLWGICQLRDPVMLSWLRLLRGCVTQLWSYRMSCEHRTA